MGAGQISLGTSALEGMEEGGSEVTQRQWWMILGIAVVVKVQLLLLLLFSFFGGPTPDGGVRN